MAFRCRYNDRQTIDIVTAACTRITGYTIEEVLQSRFGLLDITDPRDEESVYNDVRQSLLQFRPLETRYRILTKTGASVWVTEHSGPSIGPDGRIVFTGFIEMLRPGLER